MVERYNPGVGGTGPAMFATDKGEWVRYSDYQALENRCAELERSLKLCQSTLAAMVRPEVEATGAGIMNAYAQCIEAESKARAALAGKEGE